MSYSITLPNGEVVNVDDAIKPDDAATMIRKQKPDLFETQLLSQPGWDSLKSRAVDLVTAPFKQAEVGAKAYETKQQEEFALQQSEKYPGTEWAQKQAKKAGELRADLGTSQDELRAQTDRMKETAPPNPSLAYRAAEGTITNAPFIGGTLGTLLLGRFGGGPLAVVAGTGMLHQAGQQEADIRKQKAFAPQEGEGKQLSLSAGEQYAASGYAAETLPEVLPVGVLAKSGESTFRKWMKEYVLTDLAGEEVTTIWEALSEKAAKNPEQPFAEFARDLGQQMVDTAAQVAIQGGIVGGTAKILGMDENTPNQETQPLRKLGDSVEIQLMKPQMEAAAKKALEDATLPYTPIEGETRAAGKSVDQALQQFKDENMPEDITSAFLGAYANIPEAEVLAKGTTIQEAVAALEAAVVRPEETATQFIVGNLPILAESGIRVDEEIARLVDSGVISEQKASQILNRAATAISGTMESMRTQHVEAAAKTEALMETFTDKNVNWQELRQTELGQWGAALTAADQLLGGRMQKLTVSELTPLGLPADVATSLAGLATRNMQHAKIIQVLDFINSLVSDTGKKVKGTSLATVGTFNSASFGLLRSWDTYYDTMKDKKVTFGPNAGDILKHGFIDLAEPGSVNMVNDDPAVPMQTARRITAILRKWVTKYAPNMNIVIQFRSVMQKDALGHHLFAEHNERTGQTSHELDILIEPGMDMAKVMRTVAHEFGHALLTHYYYQADEKMREVLRHQWLKDTLGTYWNKTQPEYEMAQRPVKSASGSLAVSIRDVVARQFGSTMSGTTQNTLDYWLNFMEWQAYKLERMLVADYKGMQDPIRVYFKKALARIKQFFTKEHTLWQPDQTLQEWLQLMQQVAKNKQLENARLAMAGQMFSAGIPMPTENITIPAVTPSMEESEPITPYNQRQESSPVEAASFPNSIKALDKVLKRASPEHGSAITKAIVRFNEKWAYWLGTFQVLGLNKGVPGAERFLNALRSKFGYKSVWLREANITANTWERLGKEQAGALAKFLLTEAETDTWFSDWQEDPVNPGHYIFTIDPDKAAEFKLSEEAGAVYQQVRNMYMRALDAMETLGRERIVRQFRDDPSNPQMDAQLRELETSYANMRDRPYTPFSRFGKYYVKITARDHGLFKDPVTGTVKMYAAGQTVYFETFETENDRNTALPKLQEKYGKSPMIDAQFNTGKIHDIVYSVRNLPPQFVRAIAERLGLDEMQLREYNEIVKDLAADSSFVKHMKRKANISGYSPDTLRGFADYFQRFSNNFAKGKSAPEFEAAMADVRAYKRELEAAEVDTTKLDEFYNWMQRTFNYVMNPGNELSELKSFVAAWYLGFNVPSAVQNLTQLPFWTLPYLSQRFGTLKTVNVLRKATTDVLGSWKSMSALSEDEKAMMTYALEQGFIDESFATSIAQFAEGTALSRLTATAARHRALNWYNHKALFMFQVAEEINRRVSLLAAYRLNRKEQPKDGFDKVAFAAAREAVEVTQNEYALENRPEFMRGNKSVIFQFMHFVQNAIFRMTPWGDTSWKRLLLLQLAAGGLLGLPFAEDLMNLAKFLARKFGEAFEPELMMRQLLLELDVDPDYVLRGATSHIGPFDLSYRFSLGQVIPGMAAIGSNQRFTDAMLNAVGDVGGAGASIALNALKAVAAIDSPDKLKLVEQISPSFVRYGLQAMRVFEKGGVQTRNGATIATPSTGETLGMAIGLQPASKSAAYRKIGFESEVRNYWFARRATIYDGMFYAARAQDREALADMRKRVVEFNKEVRDIDPKMVIKPTELKQSMKLRMRKVREQEHTGTPYSTKTLAQTIEEAVPPRDDGEE